MPPSLEPMIDLLSLGGPVVWLLVAMSCLVLTLFLLKLWQLWALHRQRNAQLPSALAAWCRQDSAQALKQLNTQHPFDLMVSNAIQGLLAEPERQAQVREESERQALGLLAQLRQHLRPIEVIAHLSPLLGLLGTVLGMVVAFQQLEAAGSQVDPSVLSGGIWQALLTTAIGIAVAIPALSMHAWLDARIERLSHELNDCLTQVFTGFQPLPTQTRSASRHAA